MKRRIVSAAVALTSACSCTLAFTPNGPISTSNVALHYQSEAGNAVLDYVPTSPSKELSSYVQIVPPPAGFRQAPKRPGHPDIEVFTPTTKTRVSKDGEKLGDAKTNSESGASVTLENKSRPNLKFPQVKTNVKRPQKKRRKIKRASTSIVVHEDGGKILSKSLASSTVHDPKLEEVKRLISSVREFRRVMKARENIALRSDFAPVPDTVWAKSLDPPLTLPELRDIVIAGRNARETLISQNEGLVRQIAKKYESKNVLGSALTLQDMIQEGKVGILEAAERFDASKGYQFSTYATYWIRQRILRCLADHSRTIRLPAHVHSIVSQMNKQRQEMSQEMGRTPSISELADRMNMPVEKLKMYSERSQNVISLENPLNMNGSSYRGSVSVKDNRKLGDYIVSDSPGPQDWAEQDSLRSAIQRVMENGLSPREQHVLKLRYGLVDGNPRSLSDIAQEMHVSKDRIRSIEAKALNKLRGPGMNHKLEQFIDSADSENSEDQPRPQILSLEKPVRENGGKTSKQRKRQQNQEFDPFALDSRWSFL